MFAKPFRRNMIRTMPVFEKHLTIHHRACFFVAFIKKTVLDTEFPPPRTKEKGARYEIFSDGRAAGEGRRAESRGRREKRL